MDVARQSKAKRPHPINLGSVLVLTRIVYFALDSIQLLSPPIVIPDNVIPRHQILLPKFPKKPLVETTTTSRRETRGRPFKPQPPKEKTPSLEVLPMRDVEQATEEEDEQTQLKKAMQMSMEAQTLGLGDE